jgi:hypothetical protein
MMSMFELPANDPCVRVGLFRVRLVMRGVLGDESYRETALASEEPEEITTDLRRIYFTYEDALYATEIGRNGAVMEQVSEGAVLRYRFFSPTGKLLLGTRSSAGDPELN